MWTEGYQDGRTACEAVLPPSPINMGFDQRQLDLQGLLLDLSEKLGSDWKMVGRRLGVLEPTLENIQADYPAQQERALQMLRKWRQANGAHDLPAKLEKGLRDAKRIDLVESFVQRCSLICTRSTPVSAELQTDEREAVLISSLKNYYKLRSKVPMVPWAGKNGKIVTANLHLVYTNLELLVDIDGPDLPIHFPLKLNQLFADVRGCDDITTEDTYSGGQLAMSSSRVLARGRTGSGKTTFLLKLSSDWAQGADGPLRGAKAVFLLQLKRLHHRSNIGDAVVGSVLLHKSFTAQFVEEYIEKNQKDVVILLDGYDEFKGKSLSQQDCGNIVKMLRHEYLPNVRVLITSRPGRVEDFLKLEDHIADEYRHLEITGFSADKIDAYINKIFTSRPNLGKKLRNYLEENHLKTELASLPLMCCAFCQLTKLTGGEDFKDMNTISALFDKLIRCLLEYHPRSKEQRSHTGITKDAGEDESEDADDGDDMEFLKRRSMSAAESAASCTPAQSGQKMSNDDLILELGKVACAGFMRSSEEELVFSQSDFQECKPSADEAISWGCKFGLLVRDGEVEYRPTRFEDLVINYEQGQEIAHSITFVLKIFQEKLAGIYLARLSTGNEDMQSLFRRYLLDITSLQRVIDLGNVLMFACGASSTAARDIIGHIIQLLQPELENIALFMKGKLHYSECQRIQRLVEFCLKLNYECQSKGKINKVLLPLFACSNRLRLVGISSYATKSLGYLLEHSEGLRIEALELIRLHLNSSSEFREFLNTFPGLEDDVSNSMKRKRRQRQRVKEETLTEDKRRGMLRKSVSEERDIPKYLLQRPDDTFLAVLPLWEQVNRMQMREWSMGPVIKGLQHCHVKELIMNGVKADSKDWKNLFGMIANPAFLSLEKLTLSMTDIQDELLAHLVPGLGAQTHMKYLKLSGNEVGPDFLDAFDNIPPMEELETLILDKTEMDSESIEQLGEILNKFPALKSIDIRRNTDSDDTSIGSVLDNLYKCPQLERLMISLHKVSERCLSKMDDATILPRLQELHFVHTPIPNDVIRCVARLLPRMVSLRDLRISATPPDKTKPQPNQPKTVCPQVAEMFSSAVLEVPGLRFVSVLYTTFDASSFINLLQQFSEANKSAPKTLRFSKDCIPPDDEVRRHVRNAEKTFLKIWV